MLKFTICYIKREDKILMLNREYATWMGAWNGVGGKIEPGESPRESVMREVEEETGIVLNSIQFKGIVTWYVDGKAIGGMYTYVAELPPDYAYETPVKTAEGILDWKKIKWIVHPDNRGMASNIPRSIEKIVQDSGCYEHRCYYRNDQLVHDEFIGIDEDIERISDADVLRERIFR